MNAEGTDQEIVLMGLLVTATHRKGVGPKLGAGIVDALASVIEPIIALMEQNPEEGAESVRRAVAYVQARSDARRTEAVERDQARKAKIKPQAVEQVDDIAGGSLDDLDAQADDIAARVQPPPPAPAA